MQVFFLRILLGQGRPTVLVFIVVMLVIAWHLKVYVSIFGHIQSTWHVLG